MDDQGCGIDVIVGDWGDFAIITSLLLFNALLGFWEEHYFLAKGSAVIDSFLLIGFLLGVWMVPRFGRIRMQVIGFAGMAADMLILWQLGLIVSFAFRREDTDPPSFGIVEVGGK